jgi:phosphoribosylformylglycinamidine cyclo-ligase
MIGGETASLPEIISNFDLAGTGIGIVDIDNVITGGKIVEGDILIGIESSGIHSNGLSLARKIFFEENNFIVDDALPNDSKTSIGNELLKPTIIYVNPIIELLKTDVEVHGLAHITGGGFTNLKRLKKGTGYDIEKLPEPMAIFQAMHSLGVPLKEMYRVFNMGIGFVVIVKAEDSEKTINIIEKHNNAYIIGKVKEDPKEKVNIKTFQEGIITL